MNLIIVIVIIIISLISCDEEIRLLHTENTVVMNSVISNTGSESVTKSPAMLSSLIH